MFPIRCYTCNAVLAHKHVAYKEQLRNNVHPRTAMDALSVHRMCCRRMFLGEVDLVTDQVEYGNVDRQIDPDTLLKRNVPTSRRVACD